MRYQIEAMRKDGKLLGVSFDSKEEAEENLQWLRTHDYIKIVVYIIGSNGQVLTLRY